MNSRPQNQQMTPNIGNTVKRPAPGGGLPKVRQSNSSSIQLHNDSAVVNHETPLSQLSKKATNPVGRLPPYHQMKSGLKTQLNADLVGVEVNETENIQPEFQVDYINPTSPPKPQRQ